MSDICLSSFFIVKCLFKADSIHTHLSWTSLKQFVDALELQISTFCLNHLFFKKCTLQGGRSTLSFRGRIRIEDEAQQTDADQLSRTLLLTDKARLWAIPSLEIAADDVKCTHGCSVSDLSDEELFYFRSRGINNIDGRKLQMYGFVRDVARSVDPVTFEKVKDRVFDRLNNIVYLGKRAIKQDFASI